MDTNRRRPTSVFRCSVFGVPCSMFAGRVRLVCVPPPPPSWVGEVVCVSRWTLTKEREREATAAGENEAEGVWVDNIVRFFAAVLSLSLRSPPVPASRNIIFKENLHSVCIRTMEYTYERFRLLLRQDVSIIFDVGINTNPLWPTVTVSSAVLLFVHRHQRGRR